MAFKIEVTDTFGGEANYCWVDRATLDIPDDATRRQIILAAKAFAGWTGHRCEVDEHGDDYTIRPRGMCEIAFVTWDDQHE